MQHSLQHVSLTLSQVSKINRQSIQNFVKNDGFEYGVKCRYTKTLFFKAVLTNRVFGYRWLQQTQLVVRNLGRAANAHLRALQQLLD